MHKYKELKVWQKSMELVTEIYLLTDKFPDKERFGLISQINRASVSIPSNIAEGAGRNSTKIFTLSFYCSCLFLRNRDTVDYIS